MLLITFISVSAVGSAGVTSLEVLRLSCGRGRSLAGKKTANKLFSLASPPPTDLFTSRTLSPNSM